MYKKISSLLGLLGLLLIGCGEEATSKKTTSFKGELVQQNDKAFPLDLETRFDRLNGQVVTVQDTLYFSFLNRENHSIYVYDFHTGSLRKKIALEKEGPNAAPAPSFYFEYYIIDWNRILINNLQHYIMINDKGQVLNKSLVPESTSYFSTETIDFDNATFIKDDMLICGLRRTLAQEGNPSYKRAIFQLDSLQLIEKSIDERDFVSEYGAILAKNTKNAELGGLQGFTSNFAQAKEQLYASYAINDSIFLFENGKQTNAFYAGNPKIKVANLDAFFANTVVETFGTGGVRVYRNPKQAPTYLGLFADFDGRYIYRIMSHGAIPEYNEQSKREMPKSIGMSLIVFDTYTKQSKAFDLPHENISVYGAFISDTGIHFPLKEQEKEDQKVYAVFTMK